MSDAGAEAFLAHWRASPLRGPRARAEDALALFAWLREGHAQASREGGQAELAELETNLAMLAARLVPAAMRMADLAAVVAAARAALGGASSAMPHYWDWVGSLMNEAVFHNALAGERERHAELVAEASPILMVAPEVPALVAIANPTSAGIEAACARLLLMIVRVGARHAIIDLTHCAAGTRDAFVPYIARLAAHPNAQRTQLLVVGADAVRHHDPALAHGGRVTWLDQCAQAIKLALGK